MLYKDPFIVYDRRARRVLDTPAGDHHEYTNRWLSKYSKVQSLVEAASLELAPHAKYLRCSATINDTEFSITINEAWFHRRVYDVYLWTTGAP